MNYSICPATTHDASTWPEDVKHGSPFEYLVKVYDCGQQSVQSAVLSTALVIGSGRALSGETFDPCHVSLAVENAAAAITLHQPEFDLESHHSANVKARRGVAKFYGQNNANSD